MFEVNNKDTRTTLNQPTFLNHFAVKACIFNHKKGSERSFMTMVNSTIEESKLNSTIYVNNGALIITDNKII